MTNDDSIHGTSIKANNLILLEQAPLTAKTYMSSAIDYIDDRLGEGYAKAHPELIGAFMQTSAIDLGTAIIARAIETAATAIGDRPEYGTVLENISSVLDDIADEIKSHNKSAKL
jgi:hypothetical protein